MRTTLRSIIATIFFTFVFVTPIPSVHGQECGDVDNSGAI